MNRFSRKCLADVAHGFLATRDNIGESAADFSWRRPTQCDYSASPTTMKNLFEFSNFAPLAAKIRERSRIDFPCFALQVFSLLLCLSVCGCVVVKGIPEPQYREALRLVDKGTGHLRAMEWDAADAAFSVAEDLAPMAAAVDGRGCVALMRGNFEEAEQLFRKAYEMDKTYDEALANLALLFDLQGQQQRAKELYETFLYDAPGASGVRNNYAAVLDALGTDQTVVAHELLKAAAVQGNQIIEKNITTVVVRGREHE